MRKTTVGTDPVDDGYEDEEGDSKSDFGAQKRHYYDYKL